MLKQLPAGPPAECHLHGCLSAYEWQVARLAQTELLVTAARVAVSY